MILLKRFLLLFVVMALGLLFDVSATPVPGNELSRGSSGQALTTQHGTAGTPNLPEEENHDQSEQIPGVG
jgi:hypothetical protein